jgi:hypothetical protein
MLFCSFFSGLFIDLFRICLPYPTTLMALQLSQKFESSYKICSF